MWMHENPWPLCDFRGPTIGHARFVAAYRKHLEIMFGRQRITNMLSSSSLANSIQDLASVMQDPLGVLLFGKKAQSINLINVFCFNCFVKVLIGPIFWALWLAAGIKQCEIHLVDNIWVQIVSHFSLGHTDSVGVNSILSSLLNAYLRSQQHSPGYTT